MNAAGANIVVLDKSEKICEELANRFDNVVHCRTVRELENHTSQSGNCYLIGMGMALPAFKIFMSAG